MRRWVFIKLHCKLFEIMQGKEVSIQNVHDATNLSRTTISNFYNDKATRVDYETIEKLCLFFNCGISELFDFSGERGRKEDTK